MDYSTPPYQRSNPSVLNKPIQQQQQQNDLPKSLETLPTESPSPSPSRLRKSKTRLTDRLETAEESPEPAVVRRRRKCREAPVVAMQSPKKARRARKRSEVEIREEKDLVEEVGKPRKRRNNVRSKKEKEKVNLVNSVTPSCSSTKAEEEYGVDLDLVGKLLIVLFMSFLQTLLVNVYPKTSKHLNFRNQAEKKRELKLKESDILRLAKFVLPALNFAISKAGLLFSGEPSMTLKVAPFLLLGAEYGHFITIWRLCAIGFFGSFTVPKLYSCYAAQINNRGMEFIYLLKAFILLVLFRYVKQHVMEELEENGEAQEGEKGQQQALMVAEPEEEKEPQQALVVKIQMVLAYVLYLLNYEQEALRIVLGSDAQTDPVLVHKYLNLDPSDLDIQF
ncbi:hypothetical protein RIF29_05635 [Crotalaria pallida]|uniref:Reticulon domain-containing protein n=1 Tax=Crotalaria pallida TaxID=3830 RepID=A0AAN9J397_CROPI